MATLRPVSKLIPQQQQQQLTREPHLEDVRTPVGITPLPLEFPQSWPFTWGLGRVLLHVGVAEFVIFVSRGAKIRPEFCSALIEGNRVPEVPDTTVGNGEREAMGDQADGIDSVPVSEWSKLAALHGETW